ncbi:hypothetical protein ACFQVA_07430 [Actinomadura keratinilytica]
MSETPEQNGATRAGSGGVLEKDPRVLDPTPPERGPGLAPGGRAHRFWSARRVPAALTALVLLGASGLLLYDVVAVRAGHRAMAWRRTLARELAERPLDDTWTLVGAGVAAALGLWLLLLALTPGRRRLLQMKRSTRTSAPCCTARPPLSSCGTGRCRCPGYRAPRCG